MESQEQLRTLGKHGCIGSTHSGKPCDAPTLKDRDVCIAHADEKTRECARFGGSQPNAGRPKLPKPMDLARELVERHATAILRPHFKALGLMLHDDGSTTLLESGAIMVHQGEATTIEDLGAQIAAARELLDRVYGKPRQHSEVSGPDGGPLQVALEAQLRAERMSVEEREELLVQAGLEAAYSVRELEGAS